MRAVQSQEHVFVCVSTCMCVGSVSVRVGVSVHLCVSCVCGCLCAHVCRLHLSICLSLCAHVPLRTCLGSVASRCASAVNALALVCGCPVWNFATSAGRYVRNMRCLYMNTTVPCDAADSPASSSSDASTANASAHRRPSPPSTLSCATSASTTVTVAGCPRRKSALCIHALHRATQSST